MQTIKKTNKSSIRFLLGNNNEYSLIYKYLTNKINENAFFFAKPYIVGNTILWQTPLEGKIIPFVKLSKNEQENISFKFEKSFNELTKKIKHNTKFDDKIENYFVVPSLSDIYIVENELTKNIIITQWGSKTDDDNFPYVNIKNIITDFIIKKKNEIRIKKEQERIRIEKEQERIRIKKEQERIEMEKERERIRKLEEEEMRKKVEEQSDVLKIPDTHTDFKFAMGKWKSTSDLQKAGTKEPIELFFEFDISGKGTLTLLEKSGNKCVAPLQLSLKNKTLHIEQLTEAICENNSKYVKHTIKCVSDDNNVAHCTAETKSGSKIVEFTLSHIK